METKYKTGDIVMVPAIVREAVEREGALYYRADPLSYEVPEADIVESTRAASAYAMRELERNMRERWG